MPNPKKTCLCCGAPLGEAAKFCPKCGKPVGVTGEMLSLARQGDPQARDHLYLCTCQAVFGRILARVGSLETAEDIARDTYLDVFSNLDLVRDASAFPNWVMNTASRVTTDWCRRDGRESAGVRISQTEYDSPEAFSDEDDALLSEELNRAWLPEEAVDADEAARLADEILDDLPEAQRTVVVMHLYEGRSFQEISEELGIPVSTVRTRFGVGAKRITRSAERLEDGGTGLCSLAPLPFLLALLRRVEGHRTLPSLEQLLDQTAPVLSPHSGSDSDAAETAEPKAAEAAVQPADRAGSRALAGKVIAVAAAVVVVCAVLAAVLNAAGVIHLGGGADAADSAEVLPDDALPEGLIGPQAALDSDSEEETGTEPESQPLPEEAVEEGPDVQDGEADDSPTPEDSADSTASPEDTSNASQDSASSSSSQNSSGSQNSSSGSKSGSSSSGSGASGTSGSSSGSSGSGSDASSAEDSTAGAQSASSDSTADSSSSEGGDGSTTEESVPSVPEEPTEGYVDEDGVIHNEIWSTTPP